MSIHDRAMTPRRARTWAALRVASQRPCAERGRLDLTASQAQRHPHSAQGRCVRNATHTNSANRPLPSPGGLLLTALMLRFPAGLRALRAIAPELTLPTWFAGAYVLGVALSPVGRLDYGLSQAIVWPLLREAWAPAIRFLAACPERSEGLALGDPARMGSGQLHDVVRRLREYIEALDPQARSVMHRLKVLCRLACNALAAMVVFIAVDVLAGTRRTGAVPASRWAPAPSRRAWLPPPIASAGAGGRSSRCGVACVSIGPSRSRLRCRRGYVERAATV